MRAKTSRAGSKRRTARALTARCRTARPLDRASPGSLDSVAHHDAPLLPDLSRPAHPTRRARPPVPRGGAAASIAAIVVGLAGGRRRRSGSCSAPARARGARRDRRRATGGGTVSGAGITANGYVVARTKASVVGQGRRAAGVPRRPRGLARAAGRRSSRASRAATIAPRCSAARAARGRAPRPQLAQARRDLERARRAARARTSSRRPSSRTSRTRVDVLEASSPRRARRPQLAEANLENTRVRAPFDGTVLRKDAEVGEIVAPVVGRRRAHAHRDRHHGRPRHARGRGRRQRGVHRADHRTAQPARITLDAYPDTSFAGQVRQVVPTADRQKATVQVKVSILDRDPRILPEMGAKVVFERAGRRSRRPRRRGA